MPRVLLIEDGESTAAEIRVDLCRKGFALQHAADGQEGFELALEGAWDVLIVDRLLPRMDGIEVIRALRDRSIKTPALMLTALGAVDDRICGLRAGADDYLVKPFALGELSARLEALLRRPVGLDQSVLRLGSLEVNFVARTAVRGDRDLKLLPRELQLLDYMMRREGRVVTRPMLLEDVWNYRFSLKTNLVDVHMGRLRRKLDLPCEEAFIKNVRGIGFILRAPS